MQLLITRYSVIARFGVSFGENYMHSCSYQSCFWVIFEGFSIFSHLMHYMYLQKKSDVSVWAFNFEHSLSHFGQVSTNISDTLLKYSLSLRIQHTNQTETTAVKIIVLLHPQDFTDAPKRNNTNCVKPLHCTHLKSCVNQSSLHKGN